MDINQEPTSTQKLSKINAAALINLTLTDLWREAYTASKNVNFNRWNSVLNCIWIELGGDVKEKSDADNDFNKINQEFVDAGGIPSTKINGFEKLNKDMNEKINKIYNILLKKSLFLKRLQYKQGKGTAYEDSIEDYMD